MLDRRLFCLFMGAAPVALSAIKPSNISVSVADFGVLPGELNVGPAVRHMFNALKGVENLSLTFPAGSYRFTDIEGTCVEISDQPGLTITAIGAHFFYDGVVAPFRFTRCPQLTLDGFSVDWITLPFVQGEVIDVSAKGASAIFRLDSGFLLKDGVGLGRVVVYDRTTRAPLRGGLDTANVINKLTKIEEDTFSIQFKTALPIVRGHVLVMMHAVRGQHVFSANYCDNLRIQNVSIFASPSMGLTASSCRNVSINNVRVAVKPGTNRLLSTNADAVHLLSCRGSVNVDDSQFEGMGDDGINVTGRYLPLALDETDGHRLAFRESGDQAIIDAISTNDRINIIDSSGLNSFQEAYVTGRQGRFLQLREKLSKLVGACFFAIDEDQVPFLKVRNCQFGPNRARGVLAHKYVLIEGCVFYMQSAHAILLAPDLMWREGPCVDSVTIRGNIFVDTNILGEGKGVIHIDAFASPGGRSEVSVSGHVNGGITIEANSFLGNYSPSIFCSSAQKLVAHFNKFVDSRSSSFCIISCIDFDCSFNEYSINVSSEVPSLP